MTKSKNSKRALLASVLSTFVCIAMLIGATFAWFTDTASTSVNSIQSGTLDLQLLNESDESIEDGTLYFRNADGSGDILWEPGATYNLDKFKIKNNGNLALKYKVIIDGIFGDAKILDAIDFTVTEEGYPTVSDFKEWSGTLKPGSETGLITLTGKMKESAGNEYQDQTLDGIKITVVATQNTVEKDSKDNSYDKDAEYPVVSSAALAEAIKDISELEPGEDASITLGEDVDVTASQNLYAEHPNYGIQFPEGSNVTVNGNGKTITVDHTAFNDFNMNEGITSGELVFKNVHFKAATPGQGYATVLGFDSTANVVFEDCTFEDLYTAIICNANTVEGATVTIKNCTYTGTQYGYSLSPTDGGNKVKVIFEGNKGIDNDKISEF